MGHHTSVTCLAQLSLQSGFQGQKGPHCFTPFRPSSDSISARQMCYPMAHRGSQASKSELPKAPSHLLFLSNYCSRSAFQKVLPHPPSMCPTSRALMYMIFNSYMRVSQT